MKKIKILLLGIVSLIVFGLALIDFNISGFFASGDSVCLENNKTISSVENREDTCKDSIKEEIESFENKTATQDISTPLNIKLSGRYLEVYNNATKNLTDSESDRNKRLVAMIGLQILQSKVIEYEYEYHFYSLDYSNGGGTPAVKFYNLKDCINRVNDGQKIYTDCFGFVRLIHSIAAYSVNNTNPENVSGLSELYGYKGSYTGSNISSLAKLNCSTLIYDRLTGTGSSKNRHVAIYLYSSGNTVVYMDQAGIFEGTYQEDSYIYYKKSNPYKFNTFKNYC